MGKRIFSCILVLSLAFSLLAVPASAGWVDPAFHNLKAANIVTDETLIEEDEYISLIEFVTLVCRAGGHFAFPTDAFTWPRGYQMMAQYLNLTDLVNTHDLFGTISRYDAVQILYESTKETYQVYDTSGLDKVLPGYSTCPRKYQEAVGMMYLNGVITGRSDGMFHGWEALTVYEALTMVNRSFFADNRVAVTLPEYPYILAEFSTTATDAANRNFNIARSAESINGTILEPGQQFSFNKVVGKANGANGYKLSTVLSGGKYVPGYGGGVCQTATTLFNAVLRCNLQIDERKSHGLKASYVDPGWDATIANPYIDLKFTNTYSCPIQIKGGFDSSTNTVTFKICTTQKVECPQVELHTTGSGKEWTLHRSVNGVENYATSSKYKY